MARSQLVPITGDLLPDVCRFLHAEMNSDIPPEQWLDWLRYPWLANPPDYGFALIQPDEGVVGVMVAFYSEQTINSVTERFCNLAHYCATPKYRPESIRMLRALLARKDMTLTAFSSTRRSVAIGKATGFRTLDDRVYIIPNVDLNPVRKRLQVITDKDEIAARVDDRNRQIIRDHGPSPILKYTLITDGSDWCLSVHKVEARKGVRFSVVLYPSDRTLFRQWLGAFLAAYRATDGTWLTLCQPRFLPTRPFLAIPVAEPRPHICRPKRIDPERGDAPVDPAEITGLYSELVR
jgi:hypothetical protein